MTGLGQGKKYWSAVCFQTFKKLGLEKTPTMRFFPTNPLLHDRKTWILIPFVWPLFGRFDFKFLWPKKISTIRSRWKSVNPCLSLINHATELLKKKQPKFFNPSFLNPTVSPEFSPPFGVQTPPEIYAFEQLAMRRGNACTGEEGLIERFWTIIGPLIWAPNKVLVSWGVVALIGGGTLGFPGYRAYP